MNAARLDEWGALLRWLMRGGAYGFYWRSEGRASVWWEVGNPAPIPTTPANWYFGVHPCATIPTHNAKGEPARPEHVRSQIAVIAAINCLFADIDAKQHGGKSPALSHVNRLTPAPTAVIDSGGGYHLYWLLRDPVTITNDNRERLASVQSRWVDFVGSDPGAKDLARVLRLPGTQNRKPTYGPDFPEVRLLRVFWDKVYRLTDLTHLLPPVARKTAASEAIRRLTETKRSDPPTDDGKLLDLARNARNGAKFAALYDRGDTSGYNSQSEADAALCAILAFWTGGDLSRIDALFRLSALFRPDKWDSVRVKGKTYGAATIERAATL